MRRAASSTRPPEHRARLEAMRIVGQARGELVQAALDETRAVLALGISAALNAPIEPARFGVFRM